MRAYYNEIDPYCVQWLKNLIAAGHIASGDVDERPIEQLTPADLKGYTQCHFFAGLGGWSRALRLAGWADERPVWTGSCPCQPYSAAGKGLGESDARNLWPVWLALIGQCRPGVVIGEQVDSAIWFGWIDGVLADVEAQAYAGWHTVLPAACAGAPQIRHRLWWVAVAEYAVGRPEHETRGTRSGRNGLGRSRAVGAGKRGVSGVAVAGGLAVAGSAFWKRRPPEERPDEAEAQQWDENSTDDQSVRAVGGVELTDGHRCEQGRLHTRSAQQEQALIESGSGCGLPCAESRGLGIDGRARGECGHVDERGTAGGVGESIGARSLPAAHNGICSGKESGRSRHVELERSSGDRRLVLPVNARPQGFAGHGGNGSEPRRQRAQSERSIAAAGANGLSFWSAYDLIPCADGKARRVEPGTFPLAHGVPARVGKLRAYGNAIEPQTAASFIELFKDVI